MHHTETLSQGHPESYLTKYLGTLWPSQVDNIKLTIKRTYISKLAELDVAMMGSKNSVSGLDVVVRGATPTPTP